MSRKSSYDYIQSDDTHPTYTGGTVTAGLFGGTIGSGAARYTSFTGFAGLASCAVLMLWL